MGIEVEVFLAAIIENEGGKYVLPFSAFEKVSNGEDRALAIDPTDDGTTITFSLVSMNDVIFEEEDVD